MRSMRKEAEEASSMAIVPPIHFGVYWLANDDDDQREEADQLDQ